MAEPEQRTIRNLITRSVIKLSPLSFHPFPGSRYRDVSFSFKCIFLLKIEIFWLSEGGLEWGKDRKVSIIPGSWFHSTPWLQKYKSLKTFLVFPYSRPCFPLNPTLEILFLLRERERVQSAICSLFTFGLTSVWRPYFEFNRVLGAPYSPISSLASQKKTMGEMQGPPDPQSPKDIPERCIRRQRPK